MESYRAAAVTVAILAQGTSWAVADTQAFLPSGSIPTRIKSQRARSHALTCHFFCSGWRSRAEQKESDMLREKWPGALGGPSYQTSAM